MYFPLTIFSTSSQGCRLFECYICSSILCIKHALKAAPLSTPQWSQLVKYLVPPSTRRACNERELYCKTPVMAWDPWGQHLILTERVNGGKVSSRCKFQQQSALPYLLTRLIIVLWTSCVFLISCTTLEARIQEKY